MNYLKLKDEIVLLDNILHAEIKENTIEILYGINVPEQGNKFYGHVLDYSEVKNDVNEEKTKIEQDYEKLMNNLNVDNLENAYKSIITNRDLLIESLKDRMNQNEKTMYKIKLLIYNKFKTNKTKIKELKGILKNDI